VFRKVLSDHRKVLELKNCAKLIRFSDRGFRVQHQAQIGQKEQHDEKVKYERLEHLNMLHTPFTMLLALWFAL
jgi:hypothetical protein